MADRIPLFKERQFLGITERRWHWLGRRVLIATLVSIWGFAAYQFGAERSAALLSDAWGFVRYHATGARVTAEGDILRRMPVCAARIRANCVVDGDTAWVDDEKLRISGIDTPEIEGKCGYERDLAQRARRRLSELLSANPFSVSRSGTDQYGRTLATIYLHNRGDVGKLMVREGLARTWAGRRMPWC